MLNDHARAQKGGFFGIAAAQNIAILLPDTSPRGAGAPGEDDDWDFGTGAGFYVDATKPEYSKHYNMKTHITSELPQVIEAAGIPIVSQSCTVELGVCGVITLLHPFRILSASLSLATAWVVTEH